jgi:hypothetical protein
MYSEFSVLPLAKETEMSVLVQLLWNLLSNHFTVFCANMDIETPIKSIVSWSWDASTGNFCDYIQVVTSILSSVI